MRDRIKKVAICLLIVVASWLWISQANMMSYSTLLHNTAESLWVRAPSMVQKGEVFEFHVQGWDRWERLSCHYRGTVTFEILSYNLTTLNEFNSTLNNATPYQFTGTLFEQGLIPGFKLGNLFNLDCGRHSFIGSITDEGIHYIIVTDDLGHRSLSNPIIVTNEYPDTRLFWGDIHGHAAICDGSGYLDEVWRFAKEVAYLDFAAVSTHDDWTDMVGTAPDFGLSWGLSKSSANRWNSPHDFATLIAYEWTPMLTGYGHVNVYYRGSDGPMYSASYPQYVSQDRLWDALKAWKANTGSDVFTIPHHPAFASPAMHYDWSYYDEEMVPLVEIYSAHGSSEQMNGLKTVHPAEYKFPGHHVQDALSMGYKVGIMASGDSHDGRIGHSLQHTEANNRFQYPFTQMGLQGIGFRFGAEDYENGLVGIFSDNLTRENVFDSLKSRACYATTHVIRPYLNFSINDVSVGVNDSTVYVATPTSSRNISIFVASEGNSKIKNITLVKNNIDINYTLPNEHVFRYMYNDTDAITGMNYTGGISVNGQYKISQNAHKSLSEYSIDNPPSTNWNGADYTDITDVYYLRVIQNNGQMAWIGPIWVKIL